MYDLKITGGTVIDGTGAPGRPADVGIVDGQVVAIGDAPSEAVATIDARRRIVAPGFVDIHTHYDAQVLWDRRLTVSPWHGVTTAVLGNCGFGVAPTRPEHRERIVRTLEKVEGMSAAALVAGLGTDWPFESFPEYLDAVERVGPVINTAVMVGHTPVRLYVMGDDATERAATPDEMAAMQVLVTEALDAGALGVATSKSPTHVGAHGKPVPTRQAELDEILAVVAPLAGRANGVVQATMGPGLLFAEFARIVELTGRPLSWTALLANTGEGVPQWLLAESGKLRAAGLPVYPQASCRALQFEFTMAEPFPFESMAIFGPISAATTVEQKAAVYASAEFREELRAAMAAGRGGTLNCSWDRTVVSWYPPEPSLEERAVVDLAAERGVDPTDLVLDLALTAGLAARFRLAAYNWDEDDVAEILLDPLTILGLSDAGAHASQLCDAGFSTHLLGHWVRERRALTLEQAVHKLTAEPAEVFGLTDRGVLAEGRAADVVVFDPVTVGCGPLRRVDDLPAGAERLVADAEGVDAVVVNGRVIRRAGEDVHNDAAGPLPGRLLRHGSA